MRAAGKTGRQDGFVHWVSQTFVIPCTPKPISNANHFKCNATITETINIIIYVEG